MGRIVLGLIRGWCLLVVYAAVCVAIHTLWRRLCVTIYRSWFGVVAFSRPMRNLSSTNYVSRYWCNSLEIVDNELWKLCVTRWFDRPVCGIPSVWFLSSCDNLCMSAWRQPILHLFFSYTCTESRDTKKCRGKITSYRDLAIRDVKPIIHIDPGWSGNYWSNRLTNVCAWYMGLTQAWQFPNYSPQ